MKILLRNFLISILAINLFTLPVLSLELDTSIDDEIRKNYNPEKLEKDVALPPLPKILDINTEQKAASPQSIRKSATVQYKKCPVKSSNYCAVLKKGTKFKLKSLTSISDNMPKGTKLSFVSLYPITTTYLTIPSGTVFKGDIIDSHKPQLSGNGGLVKIRLNSIVLHNETQPINAYITKANYNKIFFNKIKGKRVYLSSMYKSTKNGRHFFSKMMRVTASLASDGSSIVLTPFSISAGVITVSGNVLISPLIALFNKGGQVSINSGSNFETKLSEDVFIYR